MQVFRQPLLVPVMSIKAQGLKARRPGTYGVQWNVWLRDAYCDWTPHTSLKVVIRFICLGTSAELVTRLSTAEL